MKWMALITTILLYGCSTPSHYAQSTSGKEGYSDKIIDPNLRMATFKGNSSTPKDRAELFAKFRAIEICREMKGGLTHILQVRDRTYVNNVSQVSTTTPSYYYGASPYYGHYYTGPRGGPAMYYSAGTQTFNETYTYPMYEVYFECKTNPVDARMSFIVVSASNLKDLVKDVRGGVQVEAILPDSPNKDKFQVGDIITKANGVRVEKLVELYQAHRNSNAKKFNVEFFREGLKKNTDVAFLDVTGMVTHAEEEIIREACKDKEFKGRHPFCKK